MSLHHSPLSPFRPSSSLPPQQPNLSSGINPGAIAPGTKPGIAHRNRYVLALLPLLLLPLTTGCAIERLADPSQNQAIPAQAAEQATTVSNDQSSASTKPRMLGDAPAEPPKPSQAIPQLMSQASSTANSELFPPAESGSHQGPLRVGNQTEHPLRIAFLAQGEVPAEGETSAVPIPGERPEWDSTTADGTARDPFHWDFAPAEGGSDGLLLALPEGDLALRSGDVIVAFAQDGSQRYWGPYVVGQTSLPYWNGKQNEWQLLVQP